MAEWLKAPVLKTGEGQTSVGSNPTLSAKKKQHPLRVLFSLAQQILGIRTHGLINAPQVRVHGDREAGSNPTLSAKK